MHTMPDRRRGRAQGYHGDTSRMFHVGRVSDGARRLCDVTKECLDAAIAQCGPGVPIARIGQARAAHAGGGGRLPDPSKGVGSAQSCRRAVRRSRCIQMCLPSCNGRALPVRKQTAHCTSKQQALSLHVKAP